MEEKDILNGEYLTPEINDPSEKAEEPVVAATPVDNEPTMGATAFNQSVAHGAAMDNEPTARPPVFTPNHFMENEPTMGPTGFANNPVHNPTPNGGFVFTPDGSRPYIPNNPQSAAYTAPQYGQPPYGAPPVPPKKSGKGAMVLGIVLALLLGVSATVFAIYVLPKLLDNPSGDDNISSSAPDDSHVGQFDNSDTESESVADETSVEEIITINPLPGETYDDLVAVYESCSDSCVTILCTVEINTGFYPHTGQSLGSGFIIEGEKDGEDGFYIVTNHHVIDGATEIQVKYNDGKLYKATLLGSDELTDIAVLKTDRTDVKPIEMGDSKNLKVGQTVVAIGTPSAEELQNTMSYGIISGLNRDIKMTNDYGTVVKTMTVIQTTATLNPGNSGGPLINMAGQVIGINAMKLMQDYEGIGFALPSTEASYIINCLIQYGKVIDNGESFVSGTAQLGISGYTVTDSIRDQFDLGDDCPDGVVVINVSRGTAVYQAGLSIYDVITEYNGTKITSIEELKGLIEKSKAGAEVSLTFYRLGRRGEESGYHTIKFKLDTAK